MFKIKLHSKDLELIIKLKYAHIENNKLIWDDNEYKGVLSDVRWLSTYGNVYLKGNTLYSSMSKIKKFKYEIDKMIPRLAHIEDNSKNGKVIWDNRAYKAKAFKDIKDKCLAGNVYSIGGYLYEKGDKFIIFIDDKSGDIVDFVFLGDRVTVTKPGGTKIVRECIIGDDGRLTMTDYI